MSIPSDPIVIVGSGLAGYNLAQEFRKLNSKTPLVIITRCDGRYYYKPSLSNALVKEQVPATFALAEVDKMEQRLNATIHTHTTVTGINTGKRQLYTQDRSIAYSKLVLACGANVVSPEVVGAAQSLRFVNNLQDYEALRAALPGKKNITILGAGFVGCEFANTLLNAGYEVNIVAPARYPLDSLLPETIGLALKQGLAEKGSKWYLQDVAKEISENSNGYDISLGSGKVLATDMILSTIGLRPNTGLAQTTGLKVNRGICVNRYLQTSNPDIYALGDCAEVEGFVLQFVAPILHSARALARTLAGEATPVQYPAMPVVLKTPACPLVFLPAPTNRTGEWQISGEGNSFKALFISEQQIHGFALTGSAVVEKMALSKEVPALLQ